MKKGGEGGFEAVDLPRNPPQSPFDKGGSQSLNLRAVTLERRSECGGVCVSRILNEPLTKFIDHRRNLVKINGIIILINHLLPLE